MIYQGHHGNIGAKQADVILPSTSYVEKKGTYVNTEGRVQQTRTAIQSGSDARDDWQILDRLALYCSGDSGAGVPAVAFPFSTIEKPIRFKRGSSLCFFFNNIKKREEAWGFGSARKIEESSLLLSSPSLFMRPLSASTPTQTQAQGAWRKKRKAIVAHLNDSSPFSISEFAAALVESSIFQSLSLPSAHALWGPVSASFGDRPTIS